MLIIYVHTKLYIAVHTLAEMDSTIIVRWYNYKFITNVFKTWFFSCVPHAQCVTISTLLEIEKSNAIFFFFNWSEKLW